MEWFLVSTPGFKTVFATENNIIKKTAPVLAYAKGQTILNFMNWLDHEFSDYKITKLEDEPITESEDV